MLITNKVYMNISISVMINLSMEVAGHQISAFFYFAKLVSYLYKRTLVAISNDFNSQFFTYRNVLIVMKH